MKLIVTPIDPKAKGSHHERLKALRLASTMERAIQDKDLGVLADAMEQAEALVRQHVKVEGKGTLDAAFEELSSDDFDALLGAMLSRSKATENGAPGVDPTKPTS